MPRAPALGAVLSHEPEAPEAAANTQAKAFGATESLQAKPAVIQADDGGVTSGNGVGAPRV